MTALGSPASYGFPGAATWSSLTNRLYVIDQISPFGMYSIDTTTGTPTFLFNCTGVPSGVNISGISWDPMTNTMFGIATNISQSQLLTINMTTGAVTTIGSASTTSPGAISLSCTSRGMLFGMDIVNDALYRWNKVTGVATYVGALGFDANYGQDAQFDHIDDKLYGAVFNLNTFSPELRVIDTLTGYATYIGTYSGIQVQTIGIRGNPPCVPTTFSQTIVACAPFSVTVGSSTYTSTGVYTDHLTNARGCDSTVTTNLTVNALPTVGANVTASVVCAGDQVTFNGSGATTYVWTGGVTDNVPFTPTMNNTYTVTGTDANGCTGTANVSVNVNALPTVTASSSASAVCDGDSVTVDGGGADTYVWSGGVSDGVLFIPSVTDTYTVTGTDVNGCTNTATVMVTVNANPVVTLSLPLDTACTTIGTLTLSGESPAGGGWSGPGVSGNTFDPVAAGVGTHTIIYTYVDNNGCTGGAMDSILVDLCTGVAQHSTAGFSVYPNPTAGVFTVNAVAGTTVEITDALGQVVKSFVAMNTVTEVNISMMNSGVYFVRMINGDAVKTTRVVKH